MHNNMPGNSALYWERTFQISYSEQDNDIYKKPDPKNPNPDLYARAEKGEYILLPRQCDLCLEIFTPESFGQVECKKHSNTITEAA